MKVLVIEAREGKIVESRVIDGDYYEIVRSVAREAMDKWDPAQSDFIAVSDKWEFNLEPMSEDMRRRLEELGLIGVGEDGTRTALIPVYTISYDNKMIDEDNYQEKGLYMIVPYIDEAMKTVFESEAADLTGEPIGIPPGIEEEEEEE